MEMITYFNEEDVGKEAKIGAAIAEADIIISGILKDQEVQ